jgi:tetratricopeptide (TPR) repeat protein
VAYETRLKQTEERKQSLKQDHFIETTSHGLEWASENRKSVIQTVGLGLAAIVVLVLIVAIISHRSAAASDAFGQAMQTYQAPLVTPGQPNDPGVKTYNSVKERSTAANAQFLAVADKYGMTTAGKNARYFAGLTYLDMGQTQSAETTLKKVADSWDKQLSSLGKEALADLYHQTGRDPQAIDLYNQLTAHPTDAVPAGLAQLQLAALYTSEGKVDQAHKIYAQLKDKDKNAKGNPGPAGSLAAQKLNPAAAGAPQL